MFTVQIGGWAKGKTLQVRRRIPVEAPLWEGSGLSLAEGVLVDLDLGWTPTGQLTARGSARTVLAMECRRCLTPVRFELDVPLDLLWVPEGDSEEDERAGGEVGFRTLSWGAQEIDLGEAVREELILAAPVYVVCREGCPGLCPRCGSELVELECNCAQAETDPRWSALRALKND